MDNREEGKRILLYIIVTFVITYLVEFGIMYTRVGLRGINTDSLASTLYFLIMFIPALSVLIVRLATKEGFENHYLKWTWNKGRGKYYIFAWVFPFLITILGAIVYFIVFPDSFDANVSYYIKAVKMPDLNPASVRSTLISQALTSLILGPVINCISCFGEEWGWRGYLLPKMLKKMQVLPAIIISGIIWGLWHLPIIIMGHNYGTDYFLFPYMGIIMMCLFCISLGAILSYVTIKTDSCIPAIIGHGAINGIASVGIYFTYDGGKALLGPAPCGLIAGIPLYISAVIICIKLSKESRG